MLPIALDAMGGDHAPRVEVEAAIHAVRNRGLRVALVGDESRLRDALDRARAKNLGGLTIRHAPEVIDMHDAAATAVRRKTRSSMRVAFDLCKAGECSAAVSAGHSGAMLACGLLVWRRLPGVERPALVVALPTVDPTTSEVGRVVLLDVGANAEPKPSALAQFAVLGAVYARLLHNKKSPRVGLLSNGSEEHKGTERTRQAHAILEERARGKGSGFDYVGYAEGRDLFRGRFDVVVTDGFTGNAVLKVAEGASDAITRLAKREVKRHPLSLFGAALLAPAMRRVRDRIDWTLTGGAPLLGVDGVAIVAHGGSSPVALTSALDMAERFAEASLSRALAEGIAENAALWGAQADNADNGGDDE
jgi:glycerol-3-phosphate acyltransferase PlsX